MMTTSKFIPRVRSYGLALEDSGFILVYALMPYIQVRSDRIPEFEDTKFTIGVTNGSARSWRKPFAGRSKWKISMVEREVLFLLICLKGRKWKSKGALDCHPLAAPPSSSRGCPSMITLVWNGTHTSPQKQVSVCAGACHQACSYVVTSCHLRSCTAKVYLIPSCCSSKQ